MTSIPDRVPRVKSLRLTWVLLAAWLTACGNSQSADGKIATKAAEAGRNADSLPFEHPQFKGVDLYTGPYRTPKHLSGLTIIGYNYTDTYIDSFTVNGVGGGNIEVSTPGSYGGGTCCAPILKDFPLPMTVDIAWNRDEGQPWCKQTVLLTGPVPDDANDFEVHFYQDGTIQVAITDYPTPARETSGRFNRVQRKETGNTNNDSKFSECGDRP